MEHNIIWQWNIDAEQNIQNHSGSFRNVALTKNGENKMVENENMQKSVRLIYTVPVGVPSRLSITECQRLVTCKCLTSIPSAPADISASKSNIFILMARMIFPSTTLPRGIGFFFNIQWYDILNTCDHCHVVLQ